MITCPICENRLESPGPIRVKGMLHGGEIVRYRCEFCDVIFGPIETIDMSIEDLGAEYAKLYEVYREGEENRLWAFRLLNLEKGRRYLDYGCGIHWLHHLEQLQSEGIDIQGYEPFDGSPKPEGKFDGIATYNVLEHFQDPVASLIEIKEMLKPGGVMLHYTPCFNYCFEQSEFHLFFFKGRSVSVMCERAGLEVEHWPRNGALYLIARNVTS